MFSVLLPLYKDRTGLITDILSQVYYIRITLVRYILRQKLLKFGLLLHFASKVITFWVTIKFCVKSYCTFGYFYILRQLLQFVA